MSRFLLKDNSLYFLIYGTHRKFPLFLSKKISNLLIEEIFFYQKKYKFELLAFSIMPCHLNLYIKFILKEDIENFERDFKSYTAKIIIKMIENNEIDDYRYICGLQCFCKKFPFQRDNPGAPYPGLSAPQTRQEAAPQTRQEAAPQTRQEAAPQTRQKPANPGCSAPGLCLEIPSLTEQSLNFIKNKKRIWRRKSWKELIDNKSVLIKKLKYIYCNEKKHKINFIVEKYCGDNYKKYL